MIHWQKFRKGGEKQIQVPQSLANEIGVLPSQQSELSWAPAQEFGVQALQCMNLEPHGLCLSLSPDLKDSYLRGVYQKSCSQTLTLLTFLHVEWMYLWMIIVRYIVDESQVHENLVTNCKPGPLFHVYTTDGHLILNLLTMVIFALANCFWIYKNTTH